MHVLNDKNTDEKTKEFLKEKYNKAKELADNLANRHQSIEKLMAFIAEKQLLFFEHGESCLIPLLQKDVATELSMNPSTVSRILSSKFCRTPHGVFPIKFLCPRNHFGKQNYNSNNSLNNFLKTIQNIQIKKFQKFCYKMEYLLQDELLLNTDKTVVFHLAFLMEEKINHQTKH